MTETPSEDRGGLRLPLMIAAAVWLVIIALGYWGGPIQQPLTALLLSRLAPIGITALTTLFMAAAGLRLMRVLRISPQPILLGGLYGAGLGLFLLAMLTLALGLTGMISAAVLYGVLIICAAVSWRELRDLLSALLIQGRPSEERPAGSIFRHCVVAFLVIAALLMALGAFVPPLDYDALEYHLGLPAMFYRAGRISAVPSNVFASFPQNVEMLYLAGMSLGGDVMEGAAIAKLINLAFAGLAALGVYAAGRQALGSRAAGLMGGASLFLMPAVAAYATVNVYVETAMMFYFVLAVLAVLFYMKGEASAGLTPLRWMILAGLAAGMAVGCKYTAALFLLPAIVLTVILCGVFIRPALARTVAHLAVFGGCALLVFVPWLARDWAFAGNPVFPFLYGAFGGEGWTAEQAVRFASAHRVASATLANVGVRFWDAMLHEQGASILVLLFLPLFPLAEGRRRSALLLTGFFVIFLAVNIAATAPAAPGASGLSAAGICRAVQPWLGIALFLTPLLVLPTNGGRYTATLWGFFVLGFFLWYVLTHQASRFLFPLVFAPVLLSAVGFTALLQTRLAGLAKAAVLAGMFFCVALIFLLHLDGFKVAIGVEDRDEFLLRQTAGSEFSYAAMKYMNEQIAPGPAGDRVLFIGEAQTFYCTRRVVASTVFNENLLTTLYVRCGGDAVRLAGALAAEEIGTLYVNWPQIRRQQETYRPEPDLTVSRVSVILERLAEAKRLRLVQGFGRQDGGRWSFEIYKLVPPVGH